MPRGSTFVFLKRTDIAVSDEDILSKQSNSYNNDKSIPLEELHRYSHYDDEFYVDIKTHTLLRTIFDVSFCSTFTCLKEEYSLNPYSLKYDRIVVTDDMARSMLQAIMYLYNEDYCSKLEEMLNNKYIRLFSEMHIPYMKYKLSNYEDYDDTDNVWHLKRLKRLLEAYLCMSEEDEDNDYILLYYAWG